MAGERSLKQRSTHGANKRGGYCARAGNQGVHLWSLIYMSMERGVRERADGEFAHKESQSTAAPLSRFRKPTHPEECVVEGNASISLSQISALFSHTTTTTFFYYYYYY